MSGGRGRGGRAGARQAGRILGSQGFCACYTASPRVRRAKQWPEFPRQHRCLSKLTQCSLAQPQHTAICLSMPTLCYLPRTAAKHRVSSYSNTVHPSLCQQLQVERLRKQTPLSDACPGACVNQGAALTGSSKAKQSVCKCRPYGTTSDAQKEQAALACTVDRPPEDAVGLSADASKHDAGQECHQRWQQAACSARFAAQPRKQLRTVTALKPNSKRGAGSLSRAAKRTAAQCRHSRAVVYFPGAAAPDRLILPS